MFKKMFLKFKYFFNKKDEIEAEKLMLKLNGKNFIQIYDIPEHVQIANVKVVFTNKKLKPNNHLFFINGILQNPGYDYSFEKYKIKYFGVINRSDIITIKWI